MNFSVKTNFFEPFLVIVCTSEYFCIVTNSYIISLENTHFEYNDDHEKYMIDQITNKIYDAQEHQLLRSVTLMGDI